MIELTMRGEPNVNWHFDTSDFTHVCSIHQDQTTLGAIDEARLRRVASFLIKVSPLALANIVLD